ncbi:flowering time control protein FPA [Syzygium oleosum]|uniref:flowering time control protein FPA n=1 Tax=Syzygium oleosum TaxID=219896 RepID=UPI0011D1C5C0|nr:flowering time control protein FPA [Syzygium oleosum]
MPPPSKSIRPSHHGAAKESGGGGDHETPPSNNLWIGNLSSDVTDADLMDVFGKYGALDATSYAARSFAFVFFKRPDDAAAAKDALQGTSVKGNPIKIEFARPAKPCKQLWVGGVNPAVSKEELEEEFLKFGKVDDFKLFRDRNTALLEYVRVEDAIQAMRNMNGKQLGGDQIRVDFLRSQPSRREHWADTHDSREFIGRGMGPTDVHAGSKRQQLSHSSGSRRGDGQPSKVLWIGYPPSVQIDEQMLHNAMILFGEIERIKSFPSRHYSFVEFRSVDEARRAKEGLQGRLFNDPRITIMFSSSDLAPGREYPAFHPGVRGPRTEMEHPFRTPQIDMFGHNHPAGPGSLPHGVGQNIAVRPFGASEYDDGDLPYGMQDVNAKNLMGPSWRRSSPPSSGLLPSPAPGVRTPVRASGSWDVYDASHFPRDSKRSRIESSLPADEASFPLRKIDDRGSAIDVGIPGPFANSHGNGRLSPMGARFTSGAGQGPDDDYIWRGLIAKGGTPVCHARCVPVGEGLAAELPEVVNCSARTSLDLLATHYKEALGFDIVFFLPDSEEEFGSYTEFLRYLGSKDRAGVAKLDDGTTLFLVPPSEFLRKVLRVTGPERLYGVVLKFAQVPGNASVQHQPHESVPLSQFADVQRMPALQPEYGYPSPKQEQVLRSTPEDAKLPQQLLYPHMGESSAMRSVSHEQAHSNAAAASQAGVALTPELIATLASLIPASTRTSSAESSQQNLRSMFPPVVPNNEPSLQAWKQEHQASDSGGYSVQQPGSQLNPPMSSVSQFQPYTSVPSTASQSIQVPAILPSTQMQESVLNASQYASVSRSFNNIPSQGGQFAASIQQYPVEVPPTSSGLYSSPLLHQHGSSGLASQVQGPPFSQLQTVVPTTYTDVSNQPQQIQSSASGAAQGTQDEVDKNQRYQSTLQFAANLLQQIQQQQQQQQQQQPTTSTHHGQGYGAGQ